MRRLALVALAACWTPPRPPGLAAIPGLLWITEPQPYRLPHYAAAMAADGDTLVVAGAHGWIARVALPDVRVVREGRAGRARLTDLLRLDAGHWLATGTDRGHAVAFVVDGDTLAAHPVALPVHAGAASYGATHAMRATDGIAIVGPGLPLAIYDPATWRVMTTLDPRIGWSRTASGGRRLFAQHEGEVVGFDLATARPVTHQPWIEAAAGSLTVVRRFTGHGSGAEVRDGDRVRFAVPAPVDTVHLDEDGKRLFVFGGTALRVYDVATARLTGRFDLGPSASGSWPALVVVGQRVVIESHASLRVVDLAAGQVTPAGAPPYGLVGQLVTDGVDVLAVGDRLWRFRGGALVAARDDRAYKPFTLARGELRRFATLEEDERDVTFATLRSLAGVSALRRWKLPQDALPGWLGRNGELVVDLRADGGKPAAIAIASGGDFAKVVTYNNDAIVDDVDVDGGYALLDLHGEVHVVRLPDGVHDTPPLRMPGCATLGKAMLEPGGGRALTFDDDVMIAWDRARGRPIAAVRVPGEIGNAVFVPGSDEILFDYGEDVLAAWTPRRGDVRAIALGEAFGEEVSPDGQRLALGFADGRIALAELGPLRAAMKPVAVTRADAPASCPGPDPFTIPADQLEAPDPDPGIDQGVDDGGD
ncbi:MAG: hypothetical protein ACM31C_04475 [Acidobacteriota bacterium]